MKILLVLFLLMFSAITVEAKQHPYKKPKNVIFMIMDGTNSDVVTLSRWYKGEPLALDGILVGGVKTYSLRSGITDSAAAATAMATGKKTSEDMIGMIPVRENNAVSVRPTSNLIEAAKKKGIATGIVSTSPIQHATPAAFSAHSLTRNDYDDIAEQQVYQEINVVLGGGKIPLLSDSNRNTEPLQQPTGIGSKLPGYRKDGENLINIIENRGYKFIQTKAQMENVSGSKVWGSFADEDIAYELDRKVLAPSQPSLADMTKKAINILSADRNGFFLFVEGSKIDWAAHKNDPIGMISEILSFDSAVKEALAFAKNDKNTLVIAVTDHGNSGLTMGNQYTNKSYSKTPAEKFIKPLKKAKLTVSGALSKLKKDRSNIIQVAGEYGLDSLSNRDFNRLKTATDIEGEMVKQLAERANLGFTTLGHSGEDVFLYSYGPAKPTGLINNTELPKYVTSFLKLPTLDDLNHSLFVDAQDYYVKKGFITKIDLSNKENPIFIAKKNGTNVQYPANKNIKNTNGQVTELKGVSIYSGNKFWICLE